MSQVEVVAGDAPWEKQETEKGAFHEPVMQSQSAENKHSEKYPLLAGAKQSAGPRGEILFRRTINTQHDSYLKQHMLDEIPVLPAAVALEIMAEAAAIAWPDWVVNEVSNLRVLNGIKFDEDNIDIEVVALASSHGDASGFRELRGCQFTGLDSRGICCHKG